MIVSDSRILHLDDKVATAKDVGEEKRHRCESVFSL